MSDGGKKDNFQGRKMSDGGKKDNFSATGGGDSRRGKGWSRMTKQEATPKRNRPRRRKHLGRLYVHAIA